MRSMADLRTWRELRRRRRERDEMLLDLGALVYELQRRGGGIGVAAMCAGGGQGGAVAIGV